MNEVSCSIWGRWLSVLLFASGDDSCSSSLIQSVFTALWCFILSDFQRSVHEYAATAVCRMSESFTAHVFVQCFSVSGIILTCAFITAAVTRHHSVLFLCLMSQSLTTPDKFMRPTHIPDWNISDEISDFGASEARLTRWPLIQLEGVQRLIWISCVEDESSSSSVMFHLSRCSNNQHRNELRARCVQFFTSEPHWVEEAANNEVNILYYSSE